MPDVFFFSSLSRAEKERETIILDTLVLSWLCQGFVWLRTRSARTRTRTSTRTRYCPDTALTLSIDDCCDVIMTHSPFPLPDSMCYMLPHLAALF